jgi:hypothetical protein
LKKRGEPRQNASALLGKDKVAGFKSQILKSNPGCMPVLAWLCQCNHPTKNVFPGKNHEQLGIEALIYKVWNCLKEERYLAEEKDSKLSPGR